MVLQSGKLTDAIWLLQVVISSPLIHVLGDPSQAPTGSRTWVNKNNNLVQVYVNDSEYYSYIYIYHIQKIWESPAVENNYSLVIG